MGRFEDLTGKRFGRLVCVRRVYVGSSKKTFWECNCDCGDKRTVCAGDLKSGKTRSCGCLLKEHQNNQVQDLSGKRFGRLAVEGFYGFKNYNSCKKAMWTCRCDCGNIVIVQGNNLKSGKTQSCGCYRTERSITVSKTHGRSHSRLYTIWACMKQRTTNPHASGYENYGERGISICNEWLNSFPTFYEWAIENGYDRDAKYGECTIDRIDVDGDYCPENCRWVSMAVQAQNKRNTRK